MCPIGIRKWELCCREFIRIISLCENHPLIKLLDCSVREGMRFCPLEYIRVMSRELERKIQGCRLYDRYINIVEGFGKLDNIIAMDLQDIISKDDSNCIHKVSTSEYSTIVSMELEVLNRQQVLIFTDGCCW